MSYQSGVKTVTAATWTKKANTLWSYPVEKLAPPPGVPLPGLRPILPASIVETSTLVPQASALAAEMLPLVQWDKVPPLAATERTAWMPVDHAVPSNAPSMPVLRALKLKGVGYGGLFGTVQPSSQRYEEELSHGHVGITADGGFVMLRTPPAPSGAMFLNRARAEFRNAEILSRSGCPSIVPIAVYRYENLTCDWDPEAKFGAVLTGGPTRTRIRVSGLFVSEPGEDTEHGIACREILNAFGSDRVRALTAIAFECGRTLRQFHEAGLYLYNGFPTNYILDIEARRVCLVDLDSSKPLTSCQPELRALEILRDVAGWLFNLGIAFLEPSVAVRFPPGRLAPGLPFQAIVGGYFADVQDVDQDGIQPFLDHFFDSYRQVYAQREEIAESPQGEELLHRFWIRRAFTYPSCIAGLVDTYRRSQLAHRYPLKYSAKEMRENAERFLASSPQTRW